MRYEPKTELEELKSATVLEMNNLLKSVGSGPGSARELSIHDAWCKSQSSQNVFRWILHFSACIELKCNLWQCKCIHYVHFCKWPVKHVCILVHSYAQYTDGENCIVRLKVTSAIFQCHSLWPCVLAEYNFEFKVSGGNETVQSRPGYDMRWMSFHGSARSQYSKSYIVPKFN